MLQKTIDGLFIFTRYLVWVLGLLGIVGSLILAFVNLSMGFSSACIFIGSELLSIAIVLALLPNSLIENKILPEILVENRFFIICVLAVLALLIVGLIYYLNGGFPPLNLIFM